MPAPHPIPTALHVRFTPIVQVTMRIERSSAAMTTHLELMRDSSKEFPEIAAPAPYLTARIWHCRYSSFTRLSACVNLQKLAIATFPEESFEVLSGLVNLETLEIVHLPRVSNLVHLAQLQKLRRLSLETLPSWDASSRVTVVDSLAPIAALPVLEELELFGVIPQSREVGELMASRSLRHVRVSKFPKAEQEKLRERFAA